MNNLAYRFLLLFIALNAVDASRWWRDTGYDGDLLNDAPEPFATPPPKSVYQKSMDMGTQPLNATTGSGIYPSLQVRQLPGCRSCISLESLCCNNGTFCCAATLVCQDAGWCCSGEQTACPGSPNVCKLPSQTCCGTGVCDEGATCCGRTCCGAGRICTEDRRCVLPDTIPEPSSSSNSSVGEEPSISDPPSSTESSTFSSSVIVDPPTSPPTSVSESPTTVSEPPTTVSEPPATVSSPPPSSDPVTETSSVSVSDSNPTLIPFMATVSIGFASSSSSVELPSAPVITDPVPSIPADPTPTETFTPPVDSSSPAADILPSSSVVLETSISNGVTLTVPRTVTPHVVTNNNAASTANLEEDGSDAVASVYPWDPRIVYSPEGAWVSTTSESTVGNCHNGTKVATIAGATITFPFEGKQIAALICNGSKGGDYSIQVDGNPASNLNGYKDPSVGGDQCVLSQPFNSGALFDGIHNITIIVKGSNAASASGGTAVEFGGFIYRGPHAFGTDTGSKPNIPAIVGGTVGGVIGGILIITLVVVIILRRRRNRRVDDAPAVHTIPVSTGTPYSTVPTTEYHDPYASSGYGPGYYPNPVAGGPQPVPAWRQTDQGPFGPGSYAAAGR